jgi:hypothetical protein
MAAASIIAPAALTQLRSGDGGDAEDEDEDVEGGPPAADTRSDRVAHRGLPVVGLPFQTGFPSPLVGGVGADAGEIVNGVAARLGLPPLGPAQPAAGDVSGRRRAGA